MDKMSAQVDFACLDEDCGQSVQFNIMELKEQKG